MKEINELKAVATRLQEDAPEVTRAKVQKLVKICHDCLKITDAPYFVKIPVRLKISVGSKNFGTV